jgi:hypothetical protein
MEIITTILLALLAMRDWSNEMFDRAALTVKMMYYPHTIEAPPFEPAAPISSNDIAYPALETPAATVEIVGLSATSNSSILNVLDDTTFAIRSGIAYPTTENLMLKHGDIGPTTTSTSTLTPDGSAVVLPVTNALAVIYTSSPPATSWSTFLWSWLAFFVRLVWPYVSMLVSVLCVGYLASQAFEIVRLNREAHKLMKQWDEVLDQRDEALRERDEALVRCAELETEAMRIDAECHSVGGELAAALGQLADAGEIADDLEIKVSRLERENDEMREALEHANSTDDTGTDEPEAAQPASDSTRSNRNTRRRRAAREKKAALTQGGEV